MRATTPSRALQPPNKMPKKGGVVAGVFSLPAADGPSETQRFLTLDDMKRLADSLVGFRVCTEHSPESVGSIERTYIDAQNRVAGVVRLSDDENGSRALRRCADREFVGFSLGMHQDDGYDADGIPIVEAKNVTHVALTSRPEFPEHTLFDCVKDGEGKTLYQRAAHSITFSSATAGMSVDEIDARIGELQRARDAQLLNRSEHTAAEKTPSDQQQATNSMQSSAPPPQQAPPAQQSPPTQTYAPPASQQQAPAQQQHQAPPPQPSQQQQAPYNYHQQQQPAYPYQQHHQAPPPPHAYPYAPPAQQQQQQYAPPPMNIPSSTGFNMMGERMEYPGQDGLNRRSDGSQFMALPDSHLNRAQRQHQQQQHYPQQQQQQQQEPVVDVYQVLARERFEKSQLQEEMARMRQRKRPVDHDDYDDDGGSNSRAEEARQHRSKQTASAKSARDEAPAPVQSKEETAKLRADLEAMREQLKKVAAAAEESAKAKADSQAAAAAAAAEAADDDLDLDDKKAAGGDEDEVAEEAPIAKQLNALRVNLDGLRSVRSSLETGSSSYKQATDPELRRTYQTLLADYGHNSEAVIRKLVDALAHFAAQQKDVSADGSSTAEAEDSPMIDESLRRRLVDIQARKHGPTRNDLDFMYGVVASHATAANTLEARNAELQRMRQQMAEQRMSQQERQARINNEAARRAAAARVGEADPKLPSKSAPMANQQQQQRMQQTQFRAPAPSSTDRAKTFVIGKPVSMGDVQSAMNKGENRISAPLMPAVTHGGLLGCKDPEAQKLVAKLIETSHGTSRLSTSAPLATISAGTGAFRVPSHMPGGFEYTRDESISKMYGGNGNTRFFDVVNN